VIGRNYTASTVNSGDKINSGLEARAEPGQDNLSEHDTIVVEIQRRCLLGYRFRGQVYAFQQYSYGKKFVKPVGLMHNRKGVPKMGEIDIYCLNHADKKGVILEIKAGNNGHDTARNQLLRAEGYLVQRFPKYSFKKVYINAKMNGSGLKFISTTSIDETIFDVLADEGAKMIKAAKMIERAREAGVHDEKLPLRKRPRLIKLEKLTTYFSRLSQK